MAPSGSYAIGWDQVTLDGVAGRGMAACRPGAAWRWTGRAIRLDGPAHILPLSETSETATLRRRARRGAGRIVTAATPDREAPADTALAGPAITVTDGRRAWRVDLVPARAGGRAIAHFPALPPPAGVDLWIASAHRVDALAPAAPTATWHGIAAGTQVDTPHGPVAVDDITPGMTVLTITGTMTPVLQATATHVSGARLCAHPDLAPVLIAPGALGGGLPRAALWLAPDQGVLLDGPHTRALWPQGPVVARARDLVDGAGIRRGRGLPGMTAHVLTLPEDAALMAQGVPLMSQPRHDLRHITAGEAAILRAAPL
jgi:hypothetical protein